MGNPDAIKYELGLTIVGALAFWIWQTVSLKRDGRALREQEEAEARAAAELRPARDVAGTDPAAASPAEYADS